MPPDSRTSLQSHSDKGVYQVPQFFFIHEENRLPPLGRLDRLRALDSESARALASAGDMLTVRSASLLGPALLVPASSRVPHPIVLRRDGLPLDIAVLARIN